SFVREAVKQRQREIEENLAAYGLARGPRRLIREADFAGEGDYGRRLGAVLTRLGPFFSAFGLYLSTRVGLLPVKDCLALAAIPDWAPSMPGGLVWELIGQIAKRDPAQIFSAFEVKPCESRLVFQVHHARLLSGEAVEVRVRHGVVERYFDRDKAELPLLNDALRGRLVDGISLESLIS